MFDAGLIHTVEISLDGGATYLGVPLFKQQVC
jgi:hypothetical protein